MLRTNGACPLFPILITLGGPAYCSLSLPALPTFYYPRNESQRRMSHPFPGNRRWSNRAEKFRHSEGSPSWHAVPSPTLRVTMVNRCFRNPKRKQGFRSNGESALHRNSGKTSRCISSDEWEAPPFGHDGVTCARGFRPTTSAGEGECHGVESMLAMKCNTFGGNPDADRDARAVHAAVGGQRPVRPVGLRVAEAAVKNAPGGRHVPLPDPSHGGPAPSNRPGPRPKAPACQARARPKGRRQQTHRPFGCSAPARSSGR